MHTTVAWIILPFTTTETLLQDAYIERPLHAEWVRPPEKLLNASATGKWVFDEV